MNYRILLDMDGLLADFTAGACQLHGKDDPYASGENNGNYDIAKILNINTNDFWLPMQKDFWANLPKTKEADEIVNLCTGLFGVENVCILSSPNLNHESLIGKLIWIETHFPQFRRQYLLGPRKQFCAAPNHVLIDDHLHNTDLFREAGGISYLYPRPWNPRHSMNEKEAMLDFHLFIDGLT